MTYQDNDDRDDDRMFLTLRGACAVACIEYAAAFGEPLNETLHEADRMYARLQHIETSLAA